MRRMQPINHIRGWVRAGYKDLFVSGATGYHIHEHMKNYPVRHATNAIECTRVKGSITSDNFGRLHRAPSQPLQGKGST